MSLLVAVPGYGAESVRRDAAVERLAEVYERGVEAFRAGQISIAIEVFEQALELNPENVDVLLHLGMAHTRLGQSAISVDYLAKAVELSPSYWDARVALARGLVGIDEKQAAIRQLEVVLESVPGHISATHLKARIDNRLVDSLPPSGSARGGFDDLAKAFERGMAAYRIGDARGAAEAFEQALRLSPDNVDALLFLGTVYSWRKRFDEGLQLLGRARELDPSYADVAIAIARVKLWQGKLDEALEEVQALLLVAPERTDATAVRAQIEERIAAIALASAPPDGQIIYEVDPQNRSEPVVDVITDAVAIERPDDTSSSVEPRAVAPLDPRLGTTAITTDVQSQVPGVVRAFNQGMDAFRAGEAQSAIASFEEVLASDEAHIDARLYLGIALGWDRQYDQALEQLRLARRERVEFPDVDVAMARVLMWQGELGEASDHVDQVLQIHPDHAEAIDVRREIRRRRVPKWRTDVAYEHSTFDDGGRADWNQVSASVAYRPSSRSTFSLSLLEEDRGYAKDRLTTVAYDRKFNDDWGGGVEFALTSSPDFKQDWHIEASARHRIRTGGFDLGDTWLRAEVRDAEYATGNVATLRIGIEQFLLANRLSLTAKGLFVVDENGDEAPGWLLRADFVVEPFQFYIGAADAPETEFGETIDTKSVFSGLAYSFWDRYSLRLVYTHEDREETYVRNAFTSVLTAQF